MPLDLRYVMAKYMHSDLTPEVIAAMGLTVGEACRDCTYKTIVGRVCSVHNTYAKRFGATVAKSEQFDITYLKEMCEGDPADNCGGQLSVLRHRQ